MPKKIQDILKEKIQEKRPWSQICIWPGTLIECVGCTKEESIKKFEEFFMQEMKAKVKYLEEVKTNPEPDDTTGETGGRNDVFFAVHEDDIGKFAVARLMMGIRWIEDVIKYNNNAYLYPKDVLKRYQPTW